MKVAQSSTGVVKNTTNNAKKGKALQNVKEGLSRFGEKMKSNSDLVDLSKEAKHLLKNDLPGYVAQKVATSKAFDLASKMADFALFGGGEEELKAEGRKAEERKTEGQKTEGQKTEGQKAEERKTEGRKTEEQKTEERKTEEQKAEGRKTEELKTEKNEKIEKQNKEELKSEEKTEKLTKEMRPKEVQRVERDVVKNGTMKRPGIFFLTGMRLLGMTDYGGIEKMAEKIQGARFYGHDQVDEIIREIDKRSPEQPVVLVGHSFGADSAVEIAKKLNTLEHSFRGVDLLVTLDAVGADHSIIPQNVAKHLNFFGEKSWFLNDGPHVARDTTRSEVLNVLRPEEHDQLDDSPEIQFAIVEGIRQALGKVGS